MTLFSWKLIMILHPIIVQNVAFFMQGITWLIHYCLLILSPLAPSKFVAHLQAILASFPIVTTLLQYLVTILSQHVIATKHDKKDKHIPERWVYGHYEMKVKENNYKVKSCYCSCKGTNVFIKVFYILTLAKNVTFCFF